MCRNKLERLAESFDSGLHGMAEEKRTAPALSQSRTVFRGKPSFLDDPLCPPTQPAQREYLPDRLSSKDLGSLVPEAEYFAFMAHPSLR